MRRVLTVLSVLVISVVVASVAYAGFQQIAVNNRISDPKWSPSTPKPDGALWNSPTATTGGALWLNNGTTTALYPVAQGDLNLEIWVQAPAPNDWTRLASYLLSAPHGQVPGSGNNYIGSGYHDITQGFNEPGMFYEVNGDMPGIPGTDNTVGPQSHFNTRLYAWTGAYDTYAAAYSAAAAHTAGVYVGDSGVFSLYSGFGGPPPIPQGLDSMPAVILAQPTPEPATLLLTASGLLGLLAYAWRKRK